MPPALFHFLDRHPIAAGWFGTVAVLGAESIAVLHELDAALSVCLRLVGIMAGLATTAFSIRRIVAACRRGRRLRRGIRSSIKGRRSVSRRSR